MLCSKMFFQSLQLNFRFFNLSLPELKFQLFSKKCFTVKDYVLIYKATYYKMNSRISLLMKNFNQNLLLGASCLLLQGCTTWFPSADKTEAVTPASTAISGQKEHLDPIEPNATKIDLKETTKVGPQHLRALPRRPEKVETIEMELDEAIEAPTSAVSQERVIYTVQKGDALSFIAKKFHVNLNQLAQENHLTNRNKLYIGQVLMIPANGVDENADYIVKKGDSLSFIAKKFNTTVDKIRTDNHLKRDVIFVGQKLSLSGEKIANSSETNQSTPIDAEKYIVQSGDILGNIARRCGMSVQQLMEINHISNPRRLRVGQVLYVKAQSVNELSSEEISSEKEPTQASSLSNTSNLLDNLEDFSEKSDEEVKNQEVKSVEEDNFEDLFDESNDIPVVPLEETK